MEQRSRRASPRKKPRRTVLLLAVVGVAIFLAAGVSVSTLGISEMSVAEAQSSDTDQQQAQLESLSGIFTVIYGDPMPGSNVETEPGYVLTDDRGNQTQLLLEESLAEPSGGPLAFNGKRVEVKGTSVPDEPEHLRVQSIQFERAVDAARARARIASGKPAAEPLVSGSKPWVSIGCRFSDSTDVTPRDQAWFQTQLGGTEPAFDHFWRQLSYGAVNLEGSQAFAWYNLPQPRSFYLDDPQTHFSGHTLNWQKIAEDCTAAADADVNFPSYVGINLMFNQALDCCSWGGSSTLTRDGQTKTYAMTWMAPGGYNNHRILAQEMGHGFGLPHSSGPYSTPYDSKWDPMSGGGTCSPPHAVYGCLGDHTIAFHKDMMGWIPSARKFVANPGTDQSITIERLGEPTTTSDYLMAQIPIGSSTTEFYTVEARRFAGYDNTGPIPGEAVVIHKVNTTLGDRLAQVVDPDNNGNPNDAGAMWLPGETFTDATNSISVQVTGATASGYSVRISNGAVIPPNDNFAAAQAISGPPASVNGTNVGATREAGDPAVTGNDSGSVWYRWTAPSSGSVEINTCTSNYDTVLGAYIESDPDPGGAPGSLAEIAANDDTSGCGINGSGSKVTFNAQANTTYQIYVSGFGSSQGDFTLRVIERKRPQVTSVTPANNATGVAPGINVTATFSEAMQASTINTSTFKLRRQGTTTFRPAAMSYNPASREATLNPNANLASGATYVATVTTGAQDLAGNPLDQSPATTGNQSKTWSFKVRR